MTAIESRLAEIRARAEAATDGPWEWAAHTTVDGDKWSVFHGESTSALAMNNDGWAPDAEFIAASRTDLPALLAAVEAVMALHKRLTFPDDGIGEPTACGHCDNETWPCPTIRAITAPLETQDTGPRREQIAHKACARHERNTRP